MTPAPEAGSHHLVWIGRFQMALLPLGALGWLFRSRAAALAFLGGGLLSLGFWWLHRTAVSGMLSPSVSTRWVFGLFSLVKLALIALGVRAMMACFSAEALPLASGILLFVGGILLEAVRLAFRPDSGD